jgi:Flp pilus assembly pilin Flp
MLHRLLAHVLTHVRREEGQDMIEYALIGGLISVAIVVAAAVGLPEAFATWAEDMAGVIAG